MTDTITLSLTFSRDSLEVISVDSGGLADVAEIQVGDTVREIQGAKVKDAADVRSVLSGLPVETPVTILVWRPKVGDVTLEPTVMPPRIDPLIAAQERYDEVLAQYTKKIVSGIDRITEQGGTAYLYSQVHLDVDSSINSVEDAEGLDLTQLSGAGAVGWEVVGVVPRTYSGSESYRSKNRRTGGPLGMGYTEQKVSLSGNVVGAYAILKLPITRESREWFHDLILATCERNFVKARGPRPSPSKPST